MDNRQLYSKNLPNALSCATSDKLWVGGSKADSNPGFLFQILFGEKLAIIELVGVALGRCG